MRIVVVAALVGCGRSGFESTTDASRDAHDGALDAAVDVAIDVPPDAYAGPRGMALHTDGSNSYVRIDSLCPSLTGAITISAWVRPDVAQTDTYAAVYAINTNAGDNYSMFMWATMTGLDGRFDYYDDVYTNGMEDSFPGADGTWNYLTAVIDGSGVGALYENGQLSNAFTTPRVVASPCRFSLGQEWDTNTASNFFVGHYDGVAVWSVAKTQADVIADMNANLVGNEPGLIGFYTFEDGTAHDDSGHGHDGTLMGATIGAAP